MGLIQRVEAFVEKLRHEDATLNRERWTEAVNHFEELLHEIASRVEALENHIHGAEPSTPSTPPATPTPAKAPTSPTTPPVQPPTTKDS